jgi:hypothetical protein
VPAPIVTVPPAATPPKAAAPLSPCLRHHGDARSRCNARLTRTRALALCRKLPTAARRAACVVRAETRYAQTLRRLDLAACRKLATRSRRAACSRRADARYRSRLRALRHKR